MAEPDSDGEYAGYAGRIAWPRSPGDLTDTTLCPACFTSLRSAVCSMCGLDLRHPAAHRLLQASTDATHALNARAAIIGRIRYDLALAAARPAVQDAAVRPAPAAAGPAAQAPVAQYRAPAQVPAVAPPAAAAPAAPALRPSAAQNQPASVPPTPVGARSAAEPARPKRSSVQIVLLIVGVSLVAVAAIFFLTVAWFVAGLEFRSAVVALLTLATLVTAAVLRRRALVATAEGIGALGAILVLLDAWALRNNDMFGLAAADGLIYWGSALLSCSVLFLVWHRLSRLRVASVAGFALAAPSVGLLVAGLTAGFDGATQLYLGFLGAALASFVYRFTVRPALLPERAIVLVLAAISLIGLITAAGFVAPDSDGAPLWAFGIVAIIAAAHCVVLLRATKTGAAPAAALWSFGYGCASLAALSAAMMIPVLAIRLQDVPFAITAPVLVAVALALSLEALGRRLAPVPAPLTTATGSRPAGTAAIVGAVSAAVVAALCALPAIAFACFPLIQALLAGITGAGDPVSEPVFENVCGLIALAGVGVLGVIVWAWGGILRPRIRWITWLATAVIIIGVAFFGSLWMVLGGYVLAGALVLAALLYAALLGSRGRPSVGRFRPELLSLMIAAEVLAYQIGWASSDSWWIGSVSVIVVAFCARMLVSRDNAAARGALLALALVLTLVAAGVAPAALGLGRHPDELANAINVVGGLAVAVALLQLAVAVPFRRGILPIERRWAFWTLLLPSAVVLVAPVAAWSAQLSPGQREAVQLPQPAAAIVLAAALLIAPVLWILLPGNRRGRNARLRPERRVAALTVAPVALVLWSTILDAIGPTAATGGIRLIAAAGIALVVCALALLAQLLRGWRLDRIALELGAALVVVPAIAAGILVGDRLLWLALILAAVIALLVAVGTDGLFASRSARRHLGWLAIALGTAGLWSRLVQSGTEAVEPFVLPLAGLLIVVAILIRRFGRIDRATGASPVAAVLILAALLVALVPIAVTSGTGTLLRPVLVAAASGVALLGSSVVRWSPARAAYCAAAGLAGAVGLLLTGVGRVGQVLTESGRPGGELEAWLLAPCAALVIAAVLVARQSDAASRRLRAVAGVVLVVTALLFLTVAEDAAIVGPADGPAPDGVAGIRAIALVIALGGVHVLSRRLPEEPLGPIVAWSAIGLAGVAMLAAISVQATDPFEWVTVPVAVALLAGQLVARGSVRRAVPAAGVFWLGLALGLLPIAVAAVDGVLLRPILLLLFAAVLALGAALLLSGLLPVRHPRWMPLARPAFGLGLAAVVVTSGGRVAGILAPGPQEIDGRLEAWLLPAALIIAAAGVFLAGRRAETPYESSRIRVGEGLVVAAMLGILAAEAAALDYAPLAGARVIALVWLFSAVHLATFWYGRRPLGTPVSWVAIAAAGIAVVAGYAHAAPDPIEIVTVPLAIALLASGLLHLDRVPAARSWPWLGSALLILLVPSLLLDITESPLWRIVGLGLVAIAVLVIGAVRKLQAPFVIGAVVLLIHAAAQLWPWISVAYGAVPWWLWLGVGGVALIVLAARYEQRIRNLRSVGQKISALR